MNSQFTTFTWKKEKKSYRLNTEDSEIAEIALTSLQHPNLSEYVTWEKSE